MTMMIRDHHIDYKILLRIKQKFKFTSNNIEMYSRLVGIKFLPIKVEKECENHPCTD